MKKKANTKGFNIMEMLIVVAIIAVLVAIAIPTFNGALTKSKEAADVANIRAAYAEVMVENLTDNVALPNEAGFKAKIGGDLNYDDASHFNYGTANAQGEITITYTATKLVNSTDNTHVFTWTLAPADAGN